jgi:hypothetical protein
MELINVNIDRYLYNSYNSHNIKNISNDNLFKWYSSNKNISNAIDLSNDFPHIYDQETYGITSSCAIASVLSYLYKFKCNADKIFSPYYLACLQYNLTKNWNTLDIYTGLCVISNNGICLETSFDNTLNLNMINDENINKEASTNIVKSYSYINIDVNNMINILNDHIPILCSIKILPKYNYKHFYDCFNDNNYWLDCYNYYLNNNEIYSVSITIVGYDKLNCEFKIRGCWGPNVGLNGYLFVSFDKFEYFKNLFFDCFIIDICNPVINKIHLFNDLTLDCNKNEVDENCIIEFDKATTPIGCKKSSSFSKTRSFSGFYDSVIDIDLYDNLDDAICSIQNNSIFNNNINVNMEY